ncbi:MAG: pirin-like C-terminal cupin domain-containing protein [Bacteroidota bacterium]
MIQLWVNLPAKDKMTTPRYQEIQTDTIPVVEVGNGSRVRVIAGDFLENKGAAKTHSELSLLDIRVKEGDEIKIDLREGSNAAVYVLSGGITLADGQSANESEIALFSQEGSELTFTAKEDTKVLLMTGQPLNEPIASYGPFVMNRAEEIQQAISDFHTGKMGSLKATFS